MSRADASTRSLRTTALLLLLGWGSLTSLNGAMAILLAIDSWQLSRDPASSSSILLWIVGTVVFLGWWMAMALVLPALVMGVIALVRLGRGLWACLTFAFIVVGAPLAAAVYSQAGPEDPEFTALEGAWIRHAIEGLCLPVVALTVLTGAWLLLRDQPEPSVALPAPVHQP